ncbi:DNA polymerase III subunit chi [Aquincola sp. S2]|uniref:DNA polymerase III subunit chi n=1 Tax=Pseudaquabacterium terrae TaxID=2732868 RepID=A0ABX2EMG3_9BURK|nr:DNA polymerase III subunit chi [Aquabacterium terrae]
MTTEVAFHTGLADKPAYACRLLRKAWRQGAQVVVTGAPEALNRLDVLLWTFEHEEFLPHARLRAGAAPDPLLEARTPIWLADGIEDWAAPQVLVNLGPGIAPGFDRFARVIDLVGSDDEDARFGRQRWRDYLAAGFKPQLHDAAAASAAQVLTRSQGD